MLSLPQKPWRRVRIVPQGGDRYTVTVVSPLDSAAEFEAMVADDLEPCLGKGDGLSDVAWEMRSMTLTTANLPAFVRRLAVECVAVDAG